MEDNMSGSYDKNSNEICMVKKSEKRFKLRDGRQYKWILR